MSAFQGRQGPLAWIGDPLGEPDAGFWGPPDQLRLPLDDRGLLLADGLFETVLVEGGEARLLGEHLERWRSSAVLLELAPPPGAGPVRRLLEAALERGGPTTAALRLNWSAGASGGRGLDRPTDPQADPQEVAAAGSMPRFWLQLSALTPCFDPVTAIVSRRERRNAHSQLSRCKTFAYGPSIAARREARSAGAGDALLRSTAGGLCCGSAANLLVRREGRWLTPPLASGCLPGVMRGRALALGLAEERPLEPEELGAAVGALLINSLGCRPLLSLDGEPLTLPAAGEAERLWRSLL